MRTQMNERLHELTDKEKLTLRLMARGHDAKSMARSLGLSVHTINERLRDARRKMEVSSSREAARLLLAAEAGELNPAVADPAPLDVPGDRFSGDRFSGDREFGADAAARHVDQEAAPIRGVGAAPRRTLIVIGGLIMTLALGLLAFAALSPAASPPPVPTHTMSAQQAANGEVVDTARRWLDLLDARRWDESYRLTGAAFRKLNTLQVWTEVSEQGRAPFGAAVSRTLLSQENLPAPPAGYEVVKFRTQFANKPEPVLETVTLEREDGGWKVVGVIIG